MSFTSLRRRHPKFFFEGDLIGGKAVLRSHLIPLSHRQNHTFFRHSAFALSRDGAAIAYLRAALMVEKLARLTRKWL